MKHIKSRIIYLIFTTKPVGKGTAFERFVSYGIIQDHNGTSEIERPVFGLGKARLQGSWLRLVLPVSTEPATIKE